MSSINRSEAYHSSLKVHNKGKNILHMNPEGKFLLKSDSITNHSFNNIKSISQYNSEFKSIDGNLSLFAENGNLKLRNGNNEILYNIKSSLEETYLDEQIEEDIYFIDLEKLDNIRDNSLLIESLNNPLCIYGNQGINNITHSNFKVISDQEIIFQALRKIRMNTMGTLSINSEKIIGSCEEDIILVSNEGEIKLGGNGLDNSAIIINNNTINFGKNIDNSANSKQININLVKQENITHDGLKITGENVFPEIDLERKNDEELNLVLNLGSREKDINNSFFAKLNNHNSKTFITSLDNFEFSLDDIGKEITWENGNINMIKNIITKFQVEIVNDNNLADNLADNNFIKGYLDRSNCGNLKTVTNSNLHLGTNNLDILNFSKNGRVGLNTKNMEASFHITNNYGKIINIRQEKTKSYFKHQVIQLENSNYIILANSFSKESNKYSLEGFLYNIDNCLLKHSIIKSDSFEEIEYSVILNHNSIVIAFCFFNQEAIFVTEISYYTQLFRRKKGITKRIINEDIEKSSFPIITNIKDGFFLIYRDTKEKEEFYIRIYSNTSEILLQTLLNTDENVSNRRIENLLFSNEEIIFMDYFEKNEKLFCYFTKLKLEFSNNKYIIKNTSRIKINIDEIKIISAKLLLYNDIIIITYLDSEGNIYRVTNDIKNNKIINQLLVSKVKNFEIINYNAKLKLLYLEDKLKMLDLETKKIEEIDNLAITDNFSYTLLKNSNNEYIKSLIVWETKEENGFNSDSILLKDSNSLFNLVKISNDKNQIEIKDNGDIFIQDLIEFSKQKGTTEIKNNLVISGIKDLKIGQQGQINYYEDNLLIYLGNKWKKIQLEDF
jgi:hypothetical protein